MTRAYPFVVWHEDDGWRAAVPDMPGCVSRGCSPEAAINGAALAMARWLDAARVRGIPKPEASDPMRILRRLGW